MRAANKRFGFLTNFNVPKLVEGFNEK